MDKDTIPDTLPDKPKKKKAEKESVTAFLQRKLPEKQLSEREKRFFILSYSKTNDLEKSWSELWA